MFEFLGSAVRSAANIATLPVSLVADAATFGGELTDRRESYTTAKARRIKRDASDMLDDIAG